MNTLFQRKVYKVVKEIPKGKVLTYKIVAKKAGYPRAWRAVGNVLNRNKNPEIPCHRVIRSNGNIGGYNRGVKRKRTLLLKEGVVVKNIKVVR
ncbi:MGMT family protein [Patescibacteria group bacterium]|nr:MGMT family protein [Patescibacteria group bacterium]